MNDGYDILAPYYDALNSEVDYEKWADFISECFARYSPEKKISSVLDLGCGTGSMTTALGKRGYDMTALDCSEEMLSVAENRARGEGMDNILFIESDMSSFELYGTVDAVVCCLDGVNHLKREDMLACFSLVSNYLEDGGLFVFDVNTPHKFATIYADRDYILEDDGVMCCWRNRLNKKGNAVMFCLTVFTEEKDGSWSRTDGTTREYSYTKKQLENALGATGMELVSVSADYSFLPPTPETDRWYITARKKSSRPITE